jgi:hypothetical protein
MQKLYHNKNKLILFILWICIYAISLDWLTPDDQPFTARTLIWNIIACGVSASHHMAFAIWAIQ